MEPGRPHTLDAILAEGEWLHRLARRLAAPGLAEDAAQTTWMRALERPPAAHVPLRRWLATVLRNALRQEHRADARRTARQAAVARPEAEPSADALAERIEVHRLVLALVRELDEPFRTTIVLRFLDGLSPHEIAERQGVALKTVYSRTDRALATLRERLDRAHGGSRAAWALVLVPGLDLSPAAASPLLPLAVMGTLQWTAVAAATLVLGVFTFALVRSGERADAPSISVARGDIVAPAGVAADGERPPAGESAAQHALATREIVSAASDRSDAIDEPAPISRRFLGAVVVEIVLPDGAPAAGALVRVEESPRFSDDADLLRVHARERDFLARGLDLRQSARRALLASLAASTADDEGRVYVDPERVATIWAMARSHGRSYAGTLALAGDTARPRSSQRLELARVEGAEIVVLDASGAPASGVLVVVEPTDRSREPWTGSLTGADGRVTIENVPVDGVSLVATAIVPGAPDTSASLVRDGETRLVLPPTGAIAVEFAPHASIPDRLGLSVAGTPSARALTVPSVDGRVLFPHVALGFEFELGAIDRMSTHTEIVRGPTARDEVVSHRFGGDPRVHTWSAVIVDEGGVPLANRPVLIRAPWRFTSSSTTLTRTRETDENGLLRFETTSDLPADAEVVLTAFDGPPSRVLRRANVRLAGEERILDRVVLAPVPALASGVVTCGGAPVRGARVRSFAVDEAGNRRVHSPSLGETSTDADGHFSLFGTTDDTRLALLVVSTGHRTDDPHVVPVGTRSDRIELVAGAHVDALLRIPEGIPTTMVGITLVYPHGARRRLFGSGPDGRSDIRLVADGVDAGPASLVVTSSISGEEFERRDVFLVEDERNDVGLIDLSDRMPFVELRVTAAGEPVPAFSLRYLDAPDWPHLWSPANPAHVVAPNRGERVLISASGCLPRELAVTAARHDVELERAGAVTLRLPLGYPAPAPTRNHTLLFERLSGDAAQWSLPYPYLSATNEYHLELGGPGRFRAQVIRLRGGAVRAPTPEVEFEVTEQHLTGSVPIELAFDLDEWSKAIADAR